jgi:hypothetical protein
MILDRTDRFTGEAGRIPSRIGNERLRSGRSGLQNAGGWVRALGSDRLRLRFESSPQPKDV